MRAEQHRQIGRNFLRFRRVYFVIVVMATIAVVRYDGGGRMDRVDIADVADVGWAGRDRAGASRG